MNLTSLQERRLKQTEHEIVFLEKETRRRGVWFSFWFSLLTVIIFYVSGYFFDYLFERTSLPAFIEKFRWVEFFAGWVCWFLIDYFFIVRSNQQRLKNRKKELVQLKIKYGLTEEPLP
jgi:hypothetical protein